MEQLITVLSVICIIIVAFTMHKITKQKETLEEKIIDLVNQLNIESAKYKALSNKIITKDVVIELNETLKRFDDLEKRIKLIIKEH